MTTCMTATCMTTCLTTTCMTTCLTIRLNYSINNIT